MKKISYAQAICEAIDEEMSRDENVMTMGEDTGFIGGDYNTSVGLMDKYGEMRVRDTPISEAGFTGMGIGMAIVGLRPVVEFMAADFTLVAADQLFNQAAKLHYMSGGQVKVPITIRCPIGAGRSAAAQHSQSLQAMFAHFPGIKVVVPSTAQEAKGLLKTAIRDDDPVVVLEHRLEFNKKYEVDDTVEPIPFGQARIYREGKDITIAATSAMVMRADNVADKLKNEGIECEIIDLRTIVPLDRDTIIKSVKRTGKLIIADEDYERCGIGAEIAADIADDIFYYLDAPIGRVANLNAPLPFSPSLENVVIPTEAKLYEKIKAYFK